MNRDRSVAIGIEVGGSKTTVALVDYNGKVLQRCYTKTLRGRPAAATLEPYLRAVDALLEDARGSGRQVRGIGVSVPGALDDTWRRPLMIPLLPSLNQFPLCELLEARYSLPALLHADVDAAILGEHRFGAGRRCNRLLYLTVNAVVGASLIIDGELERSLQQYIGHVCHLSVSTNGPRCSCGKRGCLNTLISVDAIQRMVQRAFRRGEESGLMRRLLNRECFSPQLVAEEAVRGDRVALQIYGEIARWLSTAIEKYIELFDPHMFILGGNVLDAGDLVFSQLRGTPTASSPVSVCSMVKVVPASLGSDAALIGSVVRFFSECS